MPSRRTVIRQLFSKGLVTDRDTTDLEPGEAEILQDAVWVGNGDLAKRGSLLYATGLNPVNARTQTLTKCLYYQSEVVPALAATNLVLGDEGGHIARIGSYSYTHGSATTSTASASLALTSLPVWPVTVWDGEVIVTRPTSLNSMFRWAGATAGSSAGAGTVTTTAGSNVVTGAGGSLFLTEYTTGQYIAIGDANGVTWYFLVAGVSSDTVLTLTSPAPVSMVAAAYSFQSYGHFNLCSEIDTFGTVSSAGTTVTGTGTGWGAGTNVLGVGDILGVPQDGGTAGSNRYQVSSVGSSTSLTMTVAPSPAWSSDNYIAVRRLCGYIVTKHQNRLWVAGNYAFPNRLQVTPAGFRLNDGFNGVDSSTTDAIRACMAESIDIPESEPSEGRIVALASLNEPGPLLVLRDRDAHIVYGEWPSVQVTKLGDELGAIHWASVATMDGAAFWAGPDGVFSYRPGGGVRDITQGRIRREYLDVVRAMPTISPSSLTERVPVVVTAIDGHVIVAIGDAADPTASTTYVYDVAGERWAKWTGPAVRGASVAAFPDRSMEAFITDTVTNRVLAVSPAMKPTLAGSASGVNGTFQARSGRMLLGSAGEYGRVIDTKLTYRLTGSSSPAFTIQFGSSSLDTAATVTTTTSGSAYATTRVRPASTNLGTLGRDLQVSFAESAGTITRLELNEFSWVTRGRRGRA